MRWTSGWEAILDSSATWWASPLSCASFAAMLPCVRRCWKSAHDSSTGMVFGFSPTSWAIAPAAAPLRGPGTKKLAPLRGSDPGAVGSASGLLGSRVLEYGSEHCWAAWGTAERAGAADISEIAANAVTPAAAARATATRRARSGPQALALREFICRRSTLISTGKRCEQLGCAFAQVWAITLPPTLQAHGPVSRRSSELPPARRAPSHADGRVPRLR